MRPCPDFTTRCARALRWALVTLVTTVVATGCADDPTAPPSTAPTGGAERILDFDLFVADVAPVLAAKGCDATGDCHGGGLRGAFELSPSGAKDLRFDFAQASEQVDDLRADASNLLRKPLAEAAGGAPHGVTAFESPDDAGYRAILAWIEAGEVRR